MISQKQHVIKRDGRKEPTKYDKITFRIEKLCYGLNMDYIDPPLITGKVISGMYSGITTVELDNLAAETSASMTSKHHDYATLAARIAISNLHKETKKSFSDVISMMYDLTDPDDGTHCPLISKEVYDIVMANADTLNSAIIHDRDFSYDYFGFKTLMRSYLTKIGKKVIERPQHMLMRVAIGIHKNDIEAALDSYELMSQKWFTHASPTLFNAGTPRPQLSSCFVLTMREDSIEGIIGTFRDCALISKFAGGIGLNVHCIRAKGTRIKGTNGISDGLVPMLKMFNEEARYINQGGKRPGAFAIYIEPWHSDVFEFLELRKNTGKDEMRARDLFLGLWVPDIFMERVETDGVWSLMCPHKCPGLADCHGEEFNKLYTGYEAAKKYNRQVPARELWWAIIDAQMENGVPYMMYKDHCNRKSNQKNLGTIKCSNLCTEIVEYTSPEEIAVCNLGSIALNKFVDQQKRIYDFHKLKDVTKTLTRNLNKIIDLSFYPVKEAEFSNKKNRPIGIGVQGLADAFILMRYPFDSPEARELNIQIFETIYYGALEASCELAEKLGPYDSYAGSPASNGILQYDMWGVKPTELWNWEKLKAKIKKHGLRNSLLIAPMPTASTAQILGNNESIEPYTNNLYTRRVLSGDFQVVNHHLVKDLSDCGLWDEEMRQSIIYHRGSVQEIEKIPEELRLLYRTAWEIPQISLVEMAADRGAFIDQSQSLNINFEGPTRQKMTSLHFKTWKLGLKTGMYYLRSKPAANAIQFTVDKSKVSKIVQNGHDKPASPVQSKPTPEEIEACSLANKEACIMCSG